MELGDVLIHHAGIYHKMFEDSHGYNVKRADRPPLHEQELEQLLLDDQIMKESYITIVSKNTGFDDRLS